MTKRRGYNPQPTSGTNYDSYYWPRSKTPEKQRIYDVLADLGWRFDSHFGLWFTPEGQPEAYGLLEYEVDFSEFRIQPPSIIREGIPYRATPILVYTLTREIQDV